MYYFIPTYNVIVVLSAEIHLSASIAFEIVMKSYEPQVKTEQIDHGNVHNDKKWGGATAHFKVFSCTVNLKWIVDPKMRLCQLRSEVKYTCQNFQFI